MQKLSCAIVEDDEISMTVIEGLIEKTGILNITGRFSSPKEAVLWLAVNHVDVIFLDVELPGMSGLDILKTLPHKVDVIIITGKSNYAVDAFELSVIDYLLKPVTDYRRFLAAIQKLIYKKQTIPNLKAKDQNIFVKVDSLLLKIDFDTVLWIEAFGDYVKIQTRETFYTVYSSLKKLEDKLDDNKFIRVHRSFIVNISKIQNIDPSNLEINGKIIPISQSYKEAFMNKISII